MLAKEQQAQLVAALAALDELSRMMVQPILGPMPPFLNRVVPGFSPETVERTVQGCLRDGGKLVTGSGVFDGDGRFASMYAFDTLYGGDKSGQGWEERVHPWDQGADLE